MVADSSRTQRHITPNARASLYMVVGSLGYVTNDALIRAATDEGLGVYQALCLRSIAMSVVFATAIGARRERIRRRQFSRPVLVRVAAEVIGTALFFGALVRLDFANAQTILLVVPFVVTLTAAVILRERVSRGQYAAVIAGFAGVLLVVQPTGEAFSPWSLAVLGAAAALTVREFATQRVTSDVPASFVALATAMAIGAMTGAIAVFTGWNPVSARGGVLVVAACLCLVVGYVFTIQAVRVGELSASAPFRYTTLLGAVVIGSVVFDEIPNTLTVAGCSIILVSGLSAIRLERVAARRTVAVAA